MVDQRGDGAATDVAVGRHRLGGFLSLPDDADGLVIFAHGSGSGRFSPRNTQVADALRARGLATLLFDLLTGSEARDRRNVFDIGLLAARLIEAVEWTHSDVRLASLPIGLFGASTGAAAALVAAAQIPDRIAAIVSRGGRPDMAEAALARVAAPTLLLVGGADFGVIELNEAAYAQLTCEKELVLVAGATHLFDEPGTLDRVIELAGDWFVAHLARRPLSPWNQ